MNVPTFYITPEMTRLFNTCAENKNYNSIFQFYDVDLKTLADCLKIVVLPKNSLAQHCADNFMECIQNLEPPHRQYHEYKYIATFYENIQLAVSKINWDSFYWEYRDTVDFIIKEARSQRKIDIYVLDNYYDYYHCSFHDRDFYRNNGNLIDRYKNTLRCLSKNNRIMLVGKPPIDTNITNVSDVVVSYGQQLNHQINTQIPVSNFSSHREFSIYSTLPLFNSNQPKSCENYSRVNSHEQISTHYEHSGCRNTRQNGYSPVSGRAPSSTSATYATMPCANIKPPKKCFDCVNAIDKNDRHVPNELTDRHRSNYSLDHREFSEQPANVEPSIQMGQHKWKTEQITNRSLYGQCFGKDENQYVGSSQQDARQPLSPTSSNADNQQSFEQSQVQPDKPKNLKEVQTDSDSLNSSLTIVSLPYEDLDTLKPFELNNTLRQSSEEMDVADVPLPETEKPQPLMLGDLWSDLDKPVPSQKPALRSDSSIDRGLEDWKRYAEDVKQHTTNAFIDTDPIEPKIYEKEYSEDEEQDTTINRDFHRKFQGQTERNQEELRRKREERAARRREHEEELNKMRQESKQKYLMFFNCLGLKLRFEEQEHNWMDWIQGCKQCISKLLEVFNQFVSEVRRNYRGLKHLSREDEADLQTEISFLLSDITNTYNSLEDSFEQLTNLESMFEDVLFIKVLKKCIAESTTRLLKAYTATGELSEHASQDNFQILQNTFDGLTPSLIYTTTELRRICKENSYPDNYENVQFPHIPSQN